MNDFQIQIICLPSKIKREEIEKLLKELNLEFNSLESVDVEENLITYKINFDKAMNKNEVIEKISKGKFKYHPSEKINAFEYNINEDCLVLSKPLPHSEIKYLNDYDFTINLDYNKGIGSNELIYRNKEFIDKQRNMFSYFIKQIGKNIFQGKSIMNISLPVYIFDTRTLLEMFVWQNGYCSRLLEIAGEIENDPLERLKYTTSYAVSKLHLCVAQEKPFNPILGETFQCKIEDSLFYVEQTSHHPPRSNFYIIGKNYKMYGYNEPEASASANSVEIGAKGATKIEFKDKDLHEVGFSNIILGGTVLGDRTMNFTGTLQVTDKKNDLLANIEINPDERGFFGAMLQNKKTFPDHIEGIITSLSNTTYDSGKKLYIIKDKTKDVKSKFEGEFSEQISFDDKVYWELTQNNYPKIYRQDTTLPSDSCFREDYYFLFNKDEKKAGIYKNIMEEKQRRDRKLREDYNK